VVPLNLFEVSDVEAVTNVLLREPSRGTRGEREMTATAAEGLPARALPAEREEQVHHEGPDGGGPEQAGEECDALHRAASGSRGHAVTVLFCLVVVQVTWLAALTYGAYSLLR
jgi:hypothetical protein